MLDASFIKAWSIRDPIDNLKGYSDSEARVGRTGRTYGLGYKLHLSIDSKSMLPLTCDIASANQNEKKHSLNMLNKTKEIPGKSGARLRRVIADSQYSDEKIRSAVTEVVIPYPTNQRCGIENVLRVNKKFRTYWPEERISQTSAHRSGQQLSKNSIRHGHK